MEETAAPPRRHLAPATSGWALVSSSSLQVVAPGFAWVQLACRPRELASAAADWAEQRLLVYDESRIA